MKAAAAAALVLGAAASAGAEPMFLSRQYTRCTTCHYSASGGGLLTPYGRSLSREELSTTGGSGVSVEGAEEAGREEQFLWGALGDTLGPVQAGIALRPARLEARVAGQEEGRSFLMTAEAQAAFRKAGWTVYGNFGRRPLSRGTRWDSYEHWVARELGGSTSVRAGRFLPAYGVRFADHTSFNREPLDLDNQDQVYGLEVTRTGQRHLVQASVSAGRALSILEDDGRRAAGAALRVQLDVAPRAVLVVSGQLRGDADAQPASRSGGVAFGFAPASRVSVWTQVDALSVDGVPGPPGYIVTNETSVEVVRGLWLKFSPQLRTDPGNSSAGVTRLAFQADLLPRTHWNVVLSYYRDRSRLEDLVVRTFLAQLHLYP